MNTEFTVPLDQVIDSKRWYVGSFEPEIDYNKAVFVSVSVSQISGEKKDQIIAECEVYTSFENWEKWLGEHQKEKEESLLNKKSFTIINEDVGTIEWIGKIELETEDGDDISPNEGTIHIWADSEEKALQYAEQYLRKKSLTDKKWQGATVHSIYKYEGDLENE